MILSGIVIPEERWARREYSDHVTRTAFINMIPDEIRLELQRYTDRRWHLMSILARCPGAIDLSRSNPALLFALASNWAFHKPAVTQPMRAARSLVWKKQKTIQEWLGFPGTEPVRRVLAKISSDALDIEGLLYLRDALRNPACLRLLSHLPRLNRASVMLASDRRVMNHVTPRLLEDTLEQPPVANTSCWGECDPTDIYRLMMDTIRMANIVDWKKCPRTFCSVKRVRTVHDELAPRMDVLRIKEKYNIPDRFRDPPFTGTENIIPLTTPEELCREGYLQKNCLGSHVFSVLRGREYVYRVEHPVRATLAVVVRDGFWTPDQFYKACNDPVDQETKRRIFTALFSTRRPVTQPAKPATTVVA